MVESLVPGKRAALETVVAETAAETSSTAETTAASLVKTTSLAEEN